MNSRIWRDPGFYLKNAEEEVRYLDAQKKQVPWEAVLYLPQLAVCLGQPVALLGNSLYLAEVWQL
jgi:hypothetical protein